MSVVYFSKINSLDDVDLINNKSVELMEKYIKNNNFVLEKKVPIKTHFGEEGNQTFIKPKYYEGIVNYLKQKNIESCFIETNVLYKGPRQTKQSHIKLAKEHGFTQLPIEIADGELGENYHEVKINQKHFKSCKIGDGFEKYNQFVLLNHFKGHIMAGFGGAVKQLAMGFASRGGKLAQHANKEPYVEKSKCIKCGKCIQHCPADALSLDENGINLNKKKCVGCAECIAVCPTGALGIPFGQTSKDVFYEKMAEYAYAASLNKNNIYINFAFNITNYCDCMSPTRGNNIEIVADDIGILLSDDPIALDTACLDLLEQNEGKKIFEGRQTLEYGEKIGLGSMNYEIINVEF